MAASTGFSVANTANNRLLGVPQTWEYEKHGPGGGLLIESPNYPPVLLGKCRVAGPYIELEDNNKIIYSEVHYFTLNSLQSYTFSSRLKAET
jgi:hypothetical protein